MTSAPAYEALTIAKSYLEEVEEMAQPPSRVDSDTASQMLRTLKLVNKQLEAAEAVDPNAIVEHGIDENGSDGLHDISSLRSLSFLFEGIARWYGLQERTAAIKRLERALALNEKSPDAHFLLGLFYNDSGQKEKSQMSVNRAIELDPDNIEYKKALDRISNTSAAVLRLGAFQGSWKVLLVLAGLAVIGLIGMLQGEVEMGLMQLVFWGALAGVYWWWKSR